MTIGIDRARSRARHQRLPLFIVFCWLALAFLGAGPTSAAESVIASRTTLKGDDKHTVLTLELSRATEFRLRKLTAPYRLIIEFTDLDFRLPEGSGATGAGLVHGFRYGSFGPGKSQLVIELTKPAAVKRSDLRKSADGATQLVLELAATSKQAFLADDDKATAAVAAGDPIAIASVPKRRKAESRSAKPVVVVDPGHGGVDLGSRSASGLIEKNVVLEFARRLANTLEATGRLQVIMTRSTDEFISLKDRVDLAQQKKAGLFISLHADWVVPKYANKARGLAIYTRSEQASDEEARLLAMRENSADEAAGLTAPDDEEDAVQDMLTDLWQEETRVHSRLFAQKLLKQVKSASRLLVQPHRYAAFYVLRNPEVPSVLIELGFLSNAKDAKEISSDDWQKKVAGSMLQAVEAFFAEAQQPLSAVQ